MGISEERLAGGWTLVTPDTVPKVSKAREGRLCAWCGPCCAVQQGRGFVGEEMSAEMQLILDNLFVPMCWGLDEKGMRRGKRYVPRRWVSRLVVWGVGEEMREKKSGMRGELTRMLTSLVSESVSLLAYLGGSRNAMVLHPDAQHKKEAE